MRILFVLKGLASVRHFEDVIALLADAGHQILLAPNNFGGEDKLPDILAAHANCSVVACSTRRAESAGTVAILRSARNYLRYQTPALAGAVANRRRALATLAREVSDGARELPGDLPDLLAPLSAQEARRLGETFDELEQLVPPDPRFERFIASQRPDVLLITPLVFYAAVQADFVKAARRLGIPSAYLLFSWDNLSNKGVMHERPDRTFVWNAAQKQEVVTLHGVAPDTVSVTGAPRFDWFFRCTASTTREAFCEAVGLDPRQRLIAYLGSSPFVSAREPAFTATWIEALRASSDGQLRNAQVVVRPHPRMREVWQEYPAFAAQSRSRSTLPGVAVTHAKSLTGEQGLFDTLYHADAVVGLNTTAELEAGILGKPVYTIRTPEFAPGQTGSHHFHYLLREQGGFVECAETLEQHCAQLAGGLRGQVDRAGLRAFIERFLRPHGLATPVAPLLANEIEAWARQASHGRTDGVVAEAAPRPSLWTRLTTGWRRTDRAAAASAVSELSEPGQPEKARVVYEKTPLFILAATQAERERCLDPGREQPWTVAWLDDNVQPGDVVYDIGANVGVFSLIAAANLDGRGAVIAFEPGYASYGRLCENIRLNRFTRFIVPVPVPLSDQPGVHRFRYKSMEPGRDGHHLSAQPWHPADKIKVSDQPMLAVSLDQAVQDFGVPPPTLIRLDADGAEHLVLRGAGPVLHAEALRGIIAAIDPKCEASVLDTLEQAGFRCTDRFGDGQSRGPRSAVFRR